MSGRQISRRGFFAVRLLAFCLALLGLPLLPACQSDAREKGIRIVFFDVGQGDATLLRTAEGDILINAGGEATQELLCSRLRQLGVRELALVVFTSPATECIGGGDGVIDSFSVREIWCNAALDENESAEQLGRAIAQREIDVRRADAFSLFQLGGAALSVLFPFAQDASEANLVLQLAYGDGRALFMGNATARQEASICEAYSRAVLQSELLSVGRHGSGTVSGKALLDAVSPQYAVISCGANNFYGYPTGELLARLEAIGTRALRTDRLGEITFVGDGGAFYLPDEREE